MKARRRFGNGEGGVELVADRHLIKLCFLFLALISKLITKVSYNMSHNMEENGQNRSRVKTWVCTLE
ncbi:hypothetical protein Y032_0091g2465 [Ancylostoma ceylanicum]|nr:hypothetical protein Y032_0091g2465 [Ancylostoma ceylanicum]